MRTSPTETFHHNRGDYRKQGNVNFFVDLHGFQHGRKKESRGHSWDAVKETTSSAKDKKNFSFRISLRIPN